MTFRGKPVVGTYGIFADFGVSAVSKFIDAVADAAPLNSLLGQPVRVKVMTTRVGNERPRFLLLEEPELLKKSG